MVLPEVIPADVLEAAAIGDDRVVAGAHWVETARMKYASGAAFSRQAAELMAQAAPAELVTRTHDAARDELRHAELCIAVARDLLDVPVELGRLPVVPARRDVSVLDIAEECFVEGCIGDGVSAARSLQAAEVSRPEIARVLAALAEDDLKHAALAWSIVAWAIRSDPRVVPSLLTTTAAWRSETLQRPDPPRRRGLARFGVLDPVAARRIADAVVAEIVVPALHQLVADRAGIPLLLS